MTNVLCIGYYDKFSRFFQSISKKLLKDNKNNTLHIQSTYLSGFLYNTVRFKTSSWISINAWIKAKINKKKYQKHLDTGNYKGIHFNDLILSDSTNPLALKYQAMAYIDILDKKLQGINILIMIGDLRLPFEIAKQIASKKSIKTYFLEQGPFHTTFIDKKGVNSNASIRYYKPNNEFNEEKKLVVSNFINAPKRSKYLRSPIYRGLDYIFDFLFINSILYPPDLIINDPIVLTKNKLISKKKINFNEVLNKNIFLLICQVPFDVNMTHHSPHYKNHYEIIKSIYHNLPKNSILIVREHPVYSGKYENDFYNFILENEAIYIDNNQDLYSILNKVHAVIVNNSTVGLEAITKLKSVLVLGDAYYDNSEICLKLNFKADLKKLLLDVLNYKPNENMVIDFLHEFFEKQVVEGFITDKKLIATERIYNRIFKDQNS